MSDNRDSLPLLPLLPGVSLARITIPEINPHFILRKELLASFKKPAPHAVLIVAPGGFGKTVLAAQWAMEKPEITAWYTAQVGDSARDILFHVIQGLRKIKPDFCAWAEELPESGFDTNKAARDFSNEVGQLGPEIRIVFDALGNASGPEEKALQEAWQENAPLNIKTFSTRQTPPYSPLVRAVNLAALTYLTAKDLRFSESEIFALASSMGVDSEDLALKASLLPTEGWPAGVHMVTRLFASGSRERYSDFDLIYNASLKSLKESEYRTLIDLSLANEFTEEEAISISNNTNIGTLLRVMSVEGLFVSKINVQPEIFKFNPLVRDYLRKSLLIAEKDFAKRATKTADAISTSDPFRAFELYLQSGNLDLAKTFALKNLRQLIFSGQTSQVLKFEEVIAEVIGLDEGRQLLLKAYLEANSGKVAMAETSLLEFEANFGGKPLSAEVAGDKDIVSTEIDFLKGNFASTITRGNQLIDVQVVIEDLVHLRFLIKLNLAASASFLMEDLHSIKVTESLLNQLSSSNDETINSIYLPSIKAMLAISKGELNTAREYSQLAIRTAKKLKASGLFTPFAAAYCLAEVYREFGDYQRAIEVCDEYIALAARDQIKPWLVAILSKKAVVLSHLSQHSQALSLLTRAREEVPMPAFGYEISRVIDEHEIFVRIPLEDEERIQELLYRMPQTTTTEAFGKAYAAMTSPTKALAILESMPTDSVRDMLNKELVATQVFHPQPKVAFEHLRRAIKIGIENDYYQVFLQQSPSVRDLIVELAAKEPTMYLERLASDIRKQIQTSQVNKKTSAGSLTKRELDILRRLSTGLPITQIAAGLHISNNTIKTHLKSVYRKLDVDSRHAAVAKAQELALV